MALNLLTAACSGPTFRDIYESGIGSEAVSVIPPKASISPGSKIPADQAGKAPGVLRNGGQWSGYDWRDGDCTVAHLKNFQSSGANRGLQARNFPGLDIDVEDEAVASAIEMLALEHLGFGPVRVRAGSPRRLIVYRRQEGHAPIRKTRLAWVDAKGTKHAVELLGAGQQFVVGGTHTTGSEYQWRCSETPCTWGPDSLTEISADHLEQFFAALAGAIEANGWGTISRGAVTSAGAGGARKGLNDPALHAPRPEMVIEALAAWPNDGKSLPTHDDFVAALAAIKAALGPDRDDHYGAIEDWALGYPGNDADYVLKVWQSIEDAAIGAEWLFQAARAAGGFTGDAQADFNDDTTAGQPKTQEQGAEEEADSSETPHARMVKRFVWVGALGRYNDTNDGGFLGGKEFNASNVAVARFGGSGQQTAEAVFQNDRRARKVAAATSRPGQPIITTDNNDRGMPVSAVNLWRPSTLKALRCATVADAAPWLDIVEKLFGPAGAPEREHFLDWCAFVLQYPGRKIGHALVLIGGQGVGKDTVLTPFFEAVGLHNVASVDTATLAGQWSFYLKAQIVYAQELITHGRRDLYNHLKPFISGQKARLAVNEKGLRQYFVPNHQNWIISSNHDNAIALEDDDRRFWVHRVLAEEPAPDEYFKKLYAWFDDGGSERVFGWLLQRDVTAFNPMARPPMTAAKQTMLDQSQPPAVRWLRDRFAEGGELASRTVVTAGELLHLAGQDFSAPEVNPKHATAVLKLAGFKPVHRVRLSDGVRQLWVRDASGLLLQLTPDRMRERYLTETNSTKNRAVA